MEALLKALMDNARETPANLARMLDLSEDEVLARIDAYEQAGVIRGYRALVNEDQLDLNRVTAVIEVKVTPEREGGFNRIAERVSRFEEVTDVHLMSGTYDLLLFVSGRDLRAVARFVSEKLATIEGVLSTATHFMLKTYKRHGVLMEGGHADERLQVSP